jgi:hypothetical protein
MRSPHYLLVVSLCCLAGCGGGGGGGVKLQGRLIKDDKPLAGGESNPLSVTFKGAAADLADPGKSFDAKVDAEGAFVVQTPDGKGVPPGKYRVVLRNPQLGPRAPKPAWLAPVADDKSPLEYEVGPEPTQKIVIDVTKKTVQREP